MLNTVIVKYSRKVTAAVYIVLIIAIPNIYDFIATDGSVYERYYKADPSAWLMPALVGFIALIIFAEEHTRQGGVAKNSRLNQVFSAVVYTVLLVFIAAMLSGFVSLLFFKPPF